MNHKLLSLPSYADHRGYFYESFSQSVNKSLNQQFYQDNISFSTKGVVRGLHYQWDNPMGKLVQTISGKIIDYIVDIRVGSPAYGCYWAYELSEENRNALWVPPGFAHGFEALEDSYVLYKCTSYYNKDGEGAINFQDKEINIKIQTPAPDMLMSDKDRVAQSLAEYAKEPKFFYEDKR